MKKQLSAGLITLLSMLNTGVALAASDWHTGTIDRILTDQRSANDATFPDALRYGGCAARVTPRPKTTLTSCGSYITMSCDAVLTSKATAKTNFDSAQLAFATGATVSFWIDDTLTISGSCFASSVIIQ